MSDWQAARYDGLPLPHVGWGARLVASMALQGDETVLDAGAGTGRDTALLLDLLPNGKVVAVDASAAMLARLRERLGDNDRVLPVRADLMRPLPVADESVDALISVAALHWLPHHRTVWGSFGAALRPAGVLRVECGGAGNISGVLAATDGLVPVGALASWTFAGVEESTELLARAGFRDLDVRLRPDPAVFPDDETFLDYLATVVLRDVDPVVVRAVAARIPSRTVDYVRLEVSAVRG